MNSQISRWIFLIFFRGNGEILRTYQMILPKFHLILPKNFFFPPRKSKFPRELFEKFFGRNPTHRRGRRSQRGFVTTVWQCSNRLSLVIVMCSSLQTDYNASALSSKGEELVGSKYCCIFVPPNGDEVTTQVAFLLGILRVSSL